MFAAYVNPKLPKRPRSEDPDDARLGAFTRVVQGPLSEVLGDIKEDDFVILGYPDDRGVDRNGGRLGAADGPDEIRRFLYNMTPNPIQTKLGKDLVIWDLGNLKSWSLNLVEAHEEARRTVKQIRETRAKIISLGGGHDWAYPDLIDSKDRLINVDAHLDMRPLVNDPDASSHSGTPFRKILTQRHDASNLSILGLQKHCNARAHVEFAKSHRASMVFLEELPWNLEKQWVMINEKFGLESDRDRFALSIDLDAFPQSIAPGVSAPQTLGLDPQLVMRLIDALGPRLRQLGVYELNPLFDRDGETARLAAKLIYKFMTSEG